jgi:hypothetical protein
MEQIECLEVMCESASSEGATQAIWWSRRRAEAKECHFETAASDAEGSVGAKSVAGHKHAGLKVNAISAFISLSAAAALECQLDSASSQ